MSSNPLIDLISSSDEQKISLIEGHFEKIMEILGLDLSDDSLSETPNRVAKMYVNEIFSGLNPANFPKVSFFENKLQSEDSSDMILVKSSFTSFCEHHFVPMHGICHVAYLPRKKLIGLSKIPRIIKHFARRPQLQERLTNEIAECFKALLETEDVAVSIKATHYCVIARGVEDCQSDTSTVTLRGRFKTDPFRSQFFTEKNSGEK